MTVLGKSPFDSAAGLSASLNSAGPGKVNEHLTGNLVVDGTVTSSGGEQLANNVYLTALNAAGSTGLDLLKADASDNTVFNALTGKKISETVNSVEVASTDINGNHLPLGKGLFLKTGTNAKAGSFIANGVTPVSVATTAFLAGSVVAISLKTIGGTVGAQPHLATTTPATGFTVVATAADTSVYNWAIIDTE